LLLGRFDEVIQEDIEDYASKNGYDACDFTIECEKKGRMSEIYNQSDDV
jgi:hypothetical protein